MKITALALTQAFQARMLVRELCKSEITICAQLVQVPFRSPAARAFGACRFCSAPALSTHSTTQFAMSFPWPCRNSVAHEAKTIATQCS